MLKLLNRHHALFSGSEIWAIPFEPTNFWFKKINWHTQFLLHNICSTTKLINPLMIATEQFFPNKAVLCMPTTDKSWIKSTHTYWLNLNRPSIRLFLQDKEGLDDIETNWSQQDLIYNLTYVKNYEKQ